MAFYYVNKLAQANGDHEVHNGNCYYLPQEPNRHYLGSFSSCCEAVKQAQKTYFQSNGCKYCCRECHVG